jgi:hypothetical protein
MIDVLESIHASRVYEDDADDYDENGLWDYENFFNFIKIKFN